MVCGIFAAPRCNLAVGLFCMRQYTTWLGTLDLHITKLREGPCCQSFFGARWLSEKVLNAVI